MLEELSALQEILGYNSSAHDTEDPGKKCEADINLLESLEYFRGIIGDEDQLSLINKPTEHGTCLIDTYGELLDHPNSMIVAKALQILTELFDDEDTDKFTEILETAATKLSPCTAAIQTLERADNQEEIDLLEQALVDWVGACPELVAKENSVTKILYFILEIASRSGNPEAAQNASEAALSLVLEKEEWTYEAIPSLKLCNIFSHRERSCLERETFDNICNILCALFLTFRNSNRTENISIIMRDLMIPICQILEHADYCLKPCLRVLADAIVLPDLADQVIAFDSLPNILCGFRLKPGDSVEIHAPMVLGALLQYSTKHYRKRLFAVFKEESIFNPLVTMTKILKKGEISPARAASLMYLLDSLEQVEDEKLSLITKAIKLETMGRLSQCLN